MLMIRSVINNLTIFPYISVCMNRREKKLPYLLIVRDIRDFERKIQRLHLIRHSYAVSVVKCANDCVICESLISLLNVERKL